MKSINDDHDIQTKIFENMRQHTKDVMEEVTQLKNTYKAQCDAFIDRIKKLNH